MEKGTFLMLRGKLLFEGCVLVCIRTHVQIHLWVRVGHRSTLCARGKKSIYVQLGQRESANTDVLKPTLPVLTALTHRSSQVELVGKGSRVRHGNGGVPLFLVWRLWKMSTLRFSFVHEARTSFSLIIFKNTKILLDTGIVWMLASMPKQGLW